MSESSRAQQAANEAEKTMLEWLLQYTPAQELKVSDVIQIAGYTRALVFRAMEPVR